MPARDPRTGWIRSLDTPAELPPRDGARDAPDELARTMADLSRRIYGADDAEAACDRVLSACVSLLDDCAFAAVSLTRRRAVTTAASTGPEADALDELQLELGEGPCVQAIADERNFCVPDLAADPRWPRFGPRALRHGARSMVACRLFTDQRTIGALNVFSPHVDGFSRADQDRMTVLAAHAAVAVDAARTRAELHDAVEGRQVIGEAIGILKERYGIDSERAFDRLRRASQHLNVKLRAVARHLSDEAEERAADTR